MTKSKPLTAGKRKSVEWPIIRLHVAGKPAVILKVGTEHDPLSYLWIGPEGDGPCFGVVADRDVKKLGEWCAAILADRRQRGKRGGR